MLLHDVGQPLIQDVLEPFRLAPVEGRQSGRKEPPELQGPAKRILGDVTGRELTNALKTSSIRIKDVAELEKLAPRTGVNLRLEVRQCEESLDFRGEC